MKKLISLLVALVMVFAISTAVACNGDNDASKNKKTGLVYEIVKQTEEKGGNYYKISKFELSSEDAKKVNENDYEDLIYDDENRLEIPAMHNGFPVKEIEAEAFANQKVIKTLVIPTTITKIGAGALEGCVNLEKITLPFVGSEIDATGTEKLFGYLFGTETADGLTEAKQRYNANTEQTQSYYLPTSLTEVIITGVEDNVEIPEYAFNGCTLLEKVTLPTGITTIPRSAFADCLGIKTFTLPDTITEIKPYGFEGCVNLLKFGFNQVEVIGENAFEGCSKLNSVVKLTLPSSLTTLGERAFKNCTALIGVDFTNASANLVVLTNTFYGCTSLKTAEFANSQKVKTGAFSGCTKLTKEGVSGNADNFEPYAFSYEYPDEEQEIKTNEGQVI